MSAPRTPGTDAQGRPRDAGLSMAELLVSVGIMALIGTMVATIAVVTLRTYVGVGARLDNTTQSELAIAASGKALRTAIMPDQLEYTVCTGCADTAILTASTTAVTFYANIGNTSVGPSLLTLRIEQDPKATTTGRLIQEVQPPISIGSGQYTFCSRSSAGCAYTSRTVARGLLWPSPGVFAYYDYNGVLMTQASLTSANLPKISSVDLGYTVQLKPGNAKYPARTAVSRVRLPNVDISVLESTP